MNQEYINNTAEQKFILVAPLDWGLGHGTRCIPLIHALQKYRATVILAAEGPLAALLTQEFPNLEIIPLKGYRIRYGKGKNSLLWKIIGQLPKIQRAINQENKWLDNLVKRRQIDGVIADNRLGLYTSKVPCVYLTHQLYIETGVKWLNDYVQNLHYKFINRFPECWVPDRQNAGGLAGKLSHPVRLPSAVLRYIGPLSRFKLQEKGQEYDLLILLSGPEPQRTLFENALLQQLKMASGSTLFIRGLPGEASRLADLPGITFHNHLPAFVLGTAIQKSKWVVARSGYSTIMDLVALQKKAILIPTPGQGEQEYLANYLHEKRMFYCCKQEEFDLSAALRNAASFSFDQHEKSTNEHDGVIQHWLLSIKGRRLPQ